MRLLLDTHIWIWWLVDDERLPDRARDAIRDPSSVVHVSAASVWEISIKEALGRLDLRDVDLVDQIEPDGFLELPIRASHALRAGRLPAHHDDPFDRMLATQARTEGLTLVTVDPALERYGVETLGPR